jgi:hypothetical protein
MTDVDSEGEIERQTSLDGEERPGDSADENETVSEVEGAEHGEENSPFEMTRKMKKRGKSPTFLA